MKLQSLAEETLAIVERGAYEAPSGRAVSIRAEVDVAERGTVLYRPDEVEGLVVRRPWALTGSTPLRVEVTSETTAEAARRLVSAERTAGVVALNFASAKNPGGGFLGGAKAQEEDLARCSALYPCQLLAPDFYAKNRASGSTLYTDHLIYSPEVPFFRDESLRLLEEPFTVSIITSPAPNAGAAARNGEGDFIAIHQTLARRAGQVLAVAAERGHRHLILGAWGCGVFRNDPEVVAEVFATWLEGPLFKGAFDRAVFAIYERGQARPNTAAFRARFSSGSAPRPT